MIIDEEAKIGMEIVLFSSWIIFKFHDTVISQFRKR